MFGKQTSHPAFVSRVYGFKLPLSAPPLPPGPSLTHSVYKDFKLATTSLLLVSVVVVVVALVVFV